MRDTELDRLIRWYAVSWMDEASGIDRLHDPHPGPGDLTGAPEWSAPFRAFILSPADSTDERGYYYRPLRAALLAVAKSNAEHYRLLTRLRETWDPDRAAWRCGVHPDHARGRMTAALRNLRRQYQLRAL